MSSSLLQRLPSSLTGRQVDGSCYTTSLCLRVFRRFKVIVHRGYVKRKTWIPRITQERFPFILTRTVPGLGVRGSYIKMLPSMGLKYILKPRHGVRGTWENFQRYYDPKVVEIEAGLRERIKEQPGKQAENAKKQDTASNSTSFQRLAYRLVITLNDNELLTIWDILYVLSSQHEIDLLPSDIEEDQIRFFPRPSDDSTTTQTMTSRATSSTSSSTASVSTIIPFVLEVPIHLPTRPQGTLIIYLKEEALPRELWDSFNFPPILVVDILPVAKTQPV